MPNTLTAWHDANDTTLRQLYDELAAIYGGSLDGGNGATDPAHIPLEVIEFGYAARALLGEGRAPGVRR